MTPPAGTSPPTLAVHHLALRVASLDAAVAFWQGGVGLPRLADHRTAAGALRSVWLALGNNAILMLECAEGRRGGPADAAGGFVLALAIPPDERESRRQALAGRGIAVVHETPFTFYVEDSEGNRLGFSHHPHPPPASGAADLG